VPAADDPWGPPGIAHFLEPLDVQVDEENQVGEFTRIITGSAAR